MSSRRVRASSCGSIMTLCRQSSQCSQARLPSLTSMVRWACFSVVLGDVMPAHAGDGDALRRTWKAARAGGSRPRSHLHLEP